MDKTKQANHKPTTKNRFISPSPSQLSPIGQVDTADETGVIQYTNLSASLLRINQMCPCLGPNGPKLCLFLSPFNENRKIRFCDVEKPEAFD
jgi:hypothetical protein